MFFQPFDELRINRNLWAYAHIPYGLFKILLRQNFRFMLFPPLALFATGLPCIHGLTPVVLSQEIIKKTSQITRNF